MKIKILATLLLFTLCHFSAISKGDNDRVFSLDKKIAFKVNGENAEKLRQKISNFLAEKRLKVESQKERERKVTSKKKFNLNFLKRKASDKPTSETEFSNESLKPKKIDTIYIYEMKDIEGYSIDIYKHNIKITFGGANMLDSAYNKLIGYYADNEREKKIAFKYHAFIAPNGYSTRLDMTKEGLWKIDLLDNIEWCISRQIKTIDIILYSPLGCVIAVPEFTHFIGDKKFGSSKIYTAQQLFDILKTESKRIKYNFIIDFSNDESSVFNEKLGYNSLSDEGRRVLSPLFEDLAIFASIGSFEIEYEGSELELEAYIMKLTKKLSNKKAKIDIKYSCKSK